ncbi:hypothetical protein ID866_8914 [Astraeus odoratus]|nr:hypothetical protein ID866_8914 [Astraeus odoratus]
MHFVVHVTSAVVKHGILTLTIPPAQPASSPALLTSDVETTSELPYKRMLITSPRIRKLTSLLSTSAYTALFVFVPIRITTHRLYPPGLISSSVFPQEELDFDPLESSEIDFEFVKTALQTCPRRSWILYTGLVGCVLVYAVEGASVMRALWLKKGDGANRPRKRSGFRGKQKAQILAGALVILVFTGLWVLSREPVFALSSVVDRYQRTFMHSWMYRL